MKNEKIFYLNAALGVVITTGTFVSLVLNLSYWNIPPLLILATTCICLLGLILSKPEKLVLKIFILVALGISAVIHIMSIIYGS